MSSHVVFVNFAGGWWVASLAALSLVGEGNASWEIYEVATGQPHAIQIADFSQPGGVKWSLQYSKTSKWPRVEDLRAKRTQ